MFGPSIYVDIPAAVTRPGSPGQDPDGAPSSPDRKIKVRRQFYLPIARQAFVTRIP